METPTRSCRRESADAMTPSLLDPIENFFGQFARPLDVLGRRFVAGVVDFREQPPDVADPIGDDRLGRIALRHVGGDGLSLADPAAGGPVDGEFLGRPQLLVEPGDQL